MNSESLTKAAKALAEKNSPTAGAKLGSQTSESKIQAAQENGAKGGRPVGS
jgi:hypothetical protein